MKIPEKFRKILLTFAILAVLLLAERFGLIEVDLGSKGVVSSGERVLHMTGAENVEGELYITPFDSWEYFEPMLLDVEDTLYIQTYEFTEKRIKEIFHLLLAKGVDIKLIMENKKYKQYNDTFTQVKEDFSSYDNFGIKSDQQMGTKYIHSKISLLDDNFWIQTANLTHSSWFKNREHFFVSSHSGVYQSLRTIFQKDWAGEGILLEDIHPNLVVCNINCRPVIEELLSSAEYSITIQTQYISDDAILQILREQADAEDFDMKLLLADTDDNEEVVRYFGSDRARVLEEPYNHTKMILIDGKTLLLGSMNLSSNSLDNNREIGILLFDFGVIEKFLEYFEQDWKSLGMS